MAQPRLSDVKLSDPKAVAEYVERRWRTRVGVVADLEQQWAENIAMVLGHQWSVFSRVQRRMVQIKRAAFREQLVINLLLPIYTREIASVLRVRPTWTSRPVTNDIRDIAAARLGTRYLQAYWEQQRMMTRLIELAAWTATCGTAFLRTEWNPFAGRPVRVMPDMAERDPATYLRLAEEFGHDREGVVRGFLGSPEVRVVSPFELDLDREATAFEDCESLVETTAESVRWAREVFRDKKIVADANDRQLMSRHWMEKVMSLSESPDTIWGSREKAGDRVLVHRFWVRPSREFPQGFRAIVCNGKTRVSGDSPYRQFQGHPYDIFKSVHAPGRVHGTCWIRQAGGVQVDFNKQRSILAEEVRNRGRPKAVLVRGSGVKDDDVQEPGKSLMINDEFERPSYLQRPEIPDWVHRVSEQNPRLIQDVTASHDVSQGKQPGSVRTGRGIAELREADASTHLPMLRLFAEGLSGVGSKLLGIAAQFITEQRLVQRYGQDLEVESFYFTGGDLLGPHSELPGADYFQVITEIRASEPLTTEGRTQQARELVELGILNPQTQQDVLLDLLDLGIRPEQVDDLRTERSNIARENLAIFQGRAPPVNPWDITPEHIEGHRRFQRSPEWRNAPPESQAIMEQHIARHTQQLSLQQGVLSGQIQPPAPGEGVDTDALGLSNLQQTQTPTESLEDLALSRRLQAQGA